MPSCFSMRSLKIWKCASTFSCASARITSATPRKCWNSSGEITASISTPPPVFAALSAA